MSDSPVKSDTKSHTGSNDGADEDSASQADPSEANAPANEAEPASDTASGAGEGDESLETSKDDDPGQATSDDEDEDESDDDEDEDHDAESSPGDEKAETDSEADSGKHETQSLLLRHPEHLKTAKVFAEVAIDAGPDGDIDPSEARARVALMLLRESLFWVRRSLGAEPASLQAGELLAGFDEGLLARVADSSGLESAKKALASEPREAKSVDAPELEALANLTRRLIHELEAPARARERGKALRLTKIAALFLVGVVVVVAATWRLVVPPDLALNAKMTTSSTLKPCLLPTDCGSAVFHTRLQQNPWVVYDLGAEHQLSTIKVHNRSDCCYERAVPLIVETSNDGKHWTQQARRDEVFLNWTASINVKARYVRLRVPRQTYFHLGPVVIR